MTGLTRRMEVILDRIGTLGRKQVGLKAFALTAFEGSATLTSSSRNDKASIIKQGVVIRGDCYVTSGDVLS